MVAENQVTLLCKKGTNTFSLNWYLENEVPAANVCLSLSLDPKTSAESFGRPDLLLNRLSLIERKV